VQNYLRWRVGCRIPDCGEVANLLLPKQQPLVRRFGIVVAIISVTLEIERTSQVETALSIFSSRRKTVATNDKRDWQELCRAAIVEQNPKEFMTIISTLLATLEESLEESKPSASIKSDSLAISGSWHS
jgi:hypothetical protein